MVGVVFLSEREVALLFLCEVQFEDGVEAVEEASELDDVVGRGGALVDAVEDHSGACGESGDLGVGAAHRCGRVGAAERFGDGGVELTVLGLFVGFDLGDEQSMGAADQLELGGCGRAC